MPNTDKKYFTLFEAIPAIQTPGEAERFLKDLCTPSELRALKERWIIAQLLKAGMSYREINEKEGLSTTTIGRVARFLNDEDYQGYSLILERLTKNEKR